MVTNAKGIICSFMAFAMFFGGVSTVHAGVSDIFRKKNTSATMSKSMQRKMKRNSEKYYKETHKEEKRIQKEAHKQAVKQAIKNLEDNAKADFLKILDISDRELRVDSVINICGEFKLIEKKLYLLNKIQGLLTPQTLNDIKQELLEELQDVYYAGFQMDNALFKQYQNVYSKINTKFSNKIDNLDEDSAINDILSVSKDLNSYVDQYINDFIYQYEDANSAALSKLLEARSNEEITKYNKSKGYQGKNVKPGGVSDDDIRNLSNKHINTVRGSKIQAMI